MSFFNIVIIVHVVKLGATQSELHVKILVLPDDVVEDLTADMLRVSYPRDTQLCFLFCYLFSICNQKKQKDIHFYLNPVGSKSFAKQSPNHGPFSHTGKSFKYEMTTILCFCLQTLFKSICWIFLLLIPIIFGSKIVKIELLLYQILQLNCFISVADKIF